MPQQRPWYTSIRFKLIFPIAFVFIALIGVNTLLLTRETIVTSDTILAELRNEVVLRVSSTLDSKLEQAIRLNQLHAEAYRNGILDVSRMDSREGYFSGLLKPYEDVAMTFIGMPDGSFYGARRLQDGTIQIVRNNETTSGNSEYYDIDAFGQSTTLAQVFENFDARKRPWYQNALEKNEISFSGLYSHFVFKVPTITASLPYYEDDVLVGVFGVDFLMTWLVDTLSSISIGEHGTVFIVNSSNQLVAASTREDIFELIDNQAVNMSASDSENPIIREAIKQDFAGNTSLNLEMEGKTYLVGRDELNVYGINWFVYTVIDKADYTTGLDTAITTMNSVALIAILLFIAFIVYSNHKFAAPILALNEHSKMLKDGSFETVKPFKHSPEMDALILSFNEMGVRIQSYVGDLEQVVKKQTKMYEDAAIEANSANIAKSRFLATMSHELRTPLTGILGMVELLKTTELSEEQREYVTLTEHTSQVLIQLINSVLDYSKIEAQQVEIEALPFTLREIRQDIEGLSNLYVKNKGLDFELYLDPIIPQDLVGDRFRLRQILTNLIGNAVKFTKAGKIKVKVEQVKREDPKNELTLRFSVSDSGLGISPHQQNLLFQPFSQGDVSTTREYGGTGLGLAICKNLVELMGGGISVDSTLGLGSTFTFTCRVGFMPEEDLDDIGESALSQRESPSANDWIQNMLMKEITILLVEDSKVIYEYIKKLAFKSKWTLHHALNGEEGIRLYQEYKDKLDIVIMDLEMPVLDGYEATRRIRLIERETDSKPVRIVAISANVLAGEREKCIGSGMDSYLSKPFRIEQLIAQFKTL